MMKCLLIAIALLIPLAAHGTVLTGTTAIPGTGLSVGSAYYLGTSGLALARANSLSTLPAVCIATTATTCVAGGTFVASGTIGNGNIGATVYVSSTTAGALVTTPPSAGNYLSAIGTLTAPNVLSISPSTYVFGL